MSTITGQKIDSVVSTSFENEAKLVFVRSLASFLGASSQLTKEKLETIIKGDLNELVNFIAQAMGLHPKISKALLALVRQNPEAIVAAVRDLCVEINVDAEIGGALAELALNKYNPEALGINKVDGKVLLVVKQLFRKLFPQFPP